MSLESIDAERKAARSAGRPVGRKTAIPPGEKAALLPRRAYSVREVCAVTGCSKSFINGLIMSGKLASKLVGHRRFIAAEALDELLSLETA